MDKLVPDPALKTPCGVGFGVAACPALGLLVTSNRDDNTLISVFALPRGASSGSGGAGGAGAAAGVRAGLALVCTLGGPSSRPPMVFKFSVSASGWLVFTDPASSGDSRPLLLATDGGHDAVHVIDVVERTHVGYVAPPGSILGPRGVATRGSLAAVSAWKDSASGDHVVQLYQGSGSTWAPLRVFGGGFGVPGRADGQLRRPFGLRFTADGTGLVVADRLNGRVSLFQVRDGSFARHVATGLTGPQDVEEVEGGWLVACNGSHTVEFIGGGDVGGGGAGVRATLGNWGDRDGEFKFPTALALVPGLGLVVREEGNYGRVQVFA